MSAILRAHVRAMARMDAEGHEVTALRRAADAARVAQLHLDASLGMVREALIALRAEHGALRLGRMLGISDQRVRNLCSGRQHAGRELIAKILEGAK